MEILKINEINSEIDFYDRVILNKLYRVDAEYTFLEEGVIIASNIIFEKHFLKNSIDKPLSNGRSFLTFFKEEIANSSLKESTRQNHLSTLELLQEFKKEVLFTDLTFEFVSSFDNYLQSKGYHLNTIAKHMKHLKRYINVAINKEYMDIQKYAFRKYKIKRVVYKTY